MLCVSCAVRTFARLTVLKFCAVSCNCQDPTCLWDEAHFRRHFGGASTAEELPTFSTLKAAMRFKRSPPMSPVRFAAELRAKVRAGELSFSVEADLGATIAMYEATFVSAFEGYAYATSSVADAEAHLFYTDCGWADQQAEILAEALEAIADRCRPLGARHISCRRDNSFSEAGLKRLAQARTYARRAEADWLDICMDARSGPAARKT